MATPLSPTDPYWLSEKNNGPGSIYDSGSMYTGTGTDPRYLPGGSFYPDVSLYAPGGGSVLGASTSAPAYDPQSQQAIDNIQAAIDRLDPQLTSGRSTIESSYQNALNQLLLGRNQANTAYTGNKQTTATDYVGAKNTIGANAGSTLSGLQRLLGSRGAGGGSAYGIAAPQAVARGATLQRADAGNIFGANNQALDTNWNNYLTGYNNEISSATNQKAQQRQALQQNIDTNRASLLQTLASLQSAPADAQPYLDQANTLLDRTANYTTAPIDYKTQAYTAPSLASYITNPQAAPTYQGQTPTNDYFSPFLGALLKKQPLAV